MSCPRGRLFGLALVVATAGVLPSCKDKKEAVGQDLSEAGYQMTTDDWFRASRGNDVQALKKFLSGGFSIETKNAAGDTALHAAAAEGAESSAKYLLDRGLPIDSIGAGGRTPLMAAVAADKPTMVSWLLRQGADPKAKDAENFRPLMLAVREGSAGSVAELAPYDREDLDPALLLAALLGRTNVIDSLTNYGASVYARMDDGRTPLMIAAENGHADSVELLLDIGASRVTTDEEGKTAAILATEAGHADIAALLNREPLPSELALESPEQVATEMDEFVAVAEAEPEIPLESGASTESTPASLARSSTRTRTAPVPIRHPSRPIEGAVLAPPREPTPAASVAAPAPAPEVSSSSPAAAPLIMRHYRETDIPIEVSSVAGDTATLRIAGKPSRQVKVKEGEAIPGSRLVVLKVRKRLEDSKFAGEEPMEVSVVEVRDRSTGESREWISGRPSTAHDPIALVEDPATGERYTAKPGQRFKSADGGEFRISDVRSNQIVIEDLSDGTTQTVPLSGPRG